MFLDFTFCSLGMLWNWPEKEEATIYHIFSRAIILIEGYWGIFDIEHTLIFGGWEELLGKNAKVPKMCAET